MEILDANADTPIQIHPPVAGVTPMYRVQFRGFRSRWAAASQGMTPREFVRAQTGMDMAEIQAASRIFIEYAFSVQFSVPTARRQRRPEPAHVLIGDQRFSVEGTVLLRFADAVDLAHQLETHVRPVVDAFVRRHAEQYGYGAPMDATWSSSFNDIQGSQLHSVVPLQGCSFCACETNVRRVGHVNTCYNEQGTCTREPLAALEMYLARERGRHVLPTAPALTDAPSKFDPPHVERIRLLYAMGLCVGRGATPLVVLAARLALTTSEFRGMVADALSARLCSTVHSVH